MSTRALPVRVQQPVAIMRRRPAETLIAVLFAIATIIGAVTASSTPSSAHVADEMARDLERAAVAAEAYLVDNPEQTAPPSVDDLTARGATVSVGTHLAVTATGHGYRLCASNEASGHRDRVLVWRSSAGASQTPVWSRDC